MRRWTSDKAWASIPDHVKRGPRISIVAWAFVDALIQGQDGFTDFELADYLGADKHEVTLLRLQLIACDGLCGNCGSPHPLCDHPKGASHGSGKPAIIEDSGTVRPSWSGYDSIVWQLNGMGRVYAMENKAHILL